MYSIGQYAIITKLNKKTLRYYDEIDLFKPAYIDPNNQYRYYERAQIPIIKEIIRLKEIGIPLEQIKTIMAGNRTENITEVYSKRLKEIEILLEQLKNQKMVIEAYLLNSNQEKNIRAEFEITKGYFIEEGKVVYNQINADYENINSAISDFYSNASNIRLSSGHIFKRNLEESTDGFTEIFAYTTEAYEGSDIRVQSQELCLRVLCEGIENRDFAYASLFDHVKDNKYNIGAIYEKYIMRNGKMQIEIMIGII